MATTVVLVAIRGERGPDDGERRDTGDDGRRFAAITGLGGGGKAGRGQCGGGDEGDELACHVLSFRVASSLLSSACPIRVGAVPIKLGPAAKTGNIAPMISDNAAIRGHFVSRDIE
jgi:hypothetical protein